MADVDLKYGPFDLESSFLYCGGGTLSIKLPHQLMKDFWHFFFQVSSCLSWGSTITPQMMCATGDGNNFNKDTCQGDSGGAENHTAV